MRPELPRTAPLESIDAGPAGRHLSRRCPERVNDVTPERRRSIWARAIALARRLARRLPSPLRAPLERFFESGPVEPRIDVPVTFGVRQLAVETAGDVHSALEEPDELPAGGDLTIRGWVAAHEPVTRVAILGFPDTALALEPREDVRARYGAFEHVAGFSGRLRVEAMDGPYFVCRIDVGSRPVHRVFGLPWKAVPPATILARRARLAGRLRCPRCGAALDGGFKAECPALTCEGCGSSFSDDARTVDCLPQTLRSEYGITSTENVSAHEYDSVAEALLGRHHDGLVLDCGAGLRPRFYPNVVNYEIVRYPTTDVLGVAERLPFVDGSFDAVISLSVLEHVRDPFAAAREILRVLRPGGELYCNVPFLEPVHGYPNHYFNMTSQGLRSLFEPGLVVERAEVLPSGWPIFSLTWILRRWADALPEEERRRFLGMRVGELTGDGTSYWHQGFVRNLPVATQFELAATTMILGYRSDAAIAAASGGQADGG